MPQTEVGEDGSGRSGAAGRSSWGRRLASSPGTSVVAGLCVGAFLATLGHCVASGAGVSAVWTSAFAMPECSDSLTALGGLVLGRVWVDGQWWRVSTAGLLHGSWLHLALNVWSLLVVGPWVERAWGSVRMLLVFCLSSVMGCAASVAWAEAPLVVGASAGILGLAGALFVGRRFGAPRLASVLAPISARGLGISIAVLVALGAVVPVIAQAGHLGGLLAGSILGFAWNGAGRGRGGWGVPAVAGVLAVLVQLGRAPTYRSQYFEFAGYRALELEDHGAAGEWFRKALSKRPEDAGLQNAVAYAYAEAGTGLDEAEILVRAALEAEPDNPDFLDTLGWILCRRGETAGGQAHLRRASELSGGSVEEIEGHLRSCAEP